MHVFRFVAASKASAGLLMLTLSIAVGGQASPSFGQETQAAMVWVADVPPGRRAEISELSSTAEARTSAVDSSGSAIRWYSPAIRKQLLGIEGFDARRLSAKRPVDQSQGTDTDPGASGTISIRADQVVWIRPEKRLTSESGGLQQMAVGEYDEALRSLLKSLQDRPPIWRQQFVSMAASQCAARGGRGSIALELVRQLDARPLPPMVLGWLPIQWRSRTIPAVAKQDTIGKFDLSDSNPSGAARLVLASWMMETNAEAAEATLAQLANIKEKSQLAALANVLRFRSANPIEVKQQWKQVLGEIEAMPVAMQTGPLVMLAEKLMAAGEQPEADKLITSLEIAPICPHPDVPASLDVWKRP